MSVIEVKCLFFYLRSFQFVEWRLSTGHSPLRPRVGVRWTVVSGVNSGDTVKRWTHQKPLAENLSSVNPPDKTSQEWTLTLTLI